MYELSNMRPSKRPSRQTELLDALRAATPRATILVQTPGHRYSYDFDTPWVTVGRSQGSDIMVDDPCVSSAHMLLIQQPLGLFLVHDLGSTNGTWINSVRVTETTLVPGIIVSLGRDTQLVIVLG